MNTQTELTVSVVNCQHCGETHGLVCPRVKAIEYHPDGTIKRVEYLTPADYMAVPLRTYEIQPVAPRIGDIICGSGFIAAKATGIPYN